MHGCMEVWLAGWVDGCMDRRVCVCVCLSVCLFVLSGRLRALAIVDKGKA